MQHYYENVPGLGNVALSRHAQLRAEEIGISDTIVRRALFEPSLKDVKEGSEILWRQWQNVRLIIVLNPKPPSGAKLIKTIIQVQPPKRKGSL
jgi:hypothetical protein